MRRITAAVALLFATVSLVAQQRPNDPRQLSIESKVLGETRNVLVRLPASYANGMQRYPLVVMTDGDAHMAHTATTADFLARNGRIPEVILVGITNTDRTRDLTPTRVERAALDGGQEFRFPTSGGAAKFLTFIETELLPKIDSEYRTLRYRVFMGHSFGGLFAFHAMTSRPKLFNAWVAVAPTLNWDNRYVNRQTAEFLEKNPELEATLFVTLGDEGKLLADEFSALSDLFAKKSPRGFRYEAATYPAEDHGTIVLPSHFAGLRSVFADWQFRLAAPADATTLWPAAREHYAKLSKRIGVDMPVPEGIANVIGYRLLQAGHHDAAIEVFRANAETWSRSANVYDSLGEAYEKSGDLANARINYEKAWKRGRELKDPNTNIFKTNFDRVNK